MGTVECVGVLVGPIIDNHVKTTADGNDELMACEMAVAAAFCASRYVIDKECALEVEREFHPVAHHREVAVGVVVPAQGDDTAVVDARLFVVVDTTHGFRFLRFCIPQSPQYSH